MTSKRIAQTNQQQKSEKPQESGILQRAAVRSVSDAEVQSTDDKEAQPLGNSALSKDFSQVPISTTQPQQIMAKLIGSSVVQQKNTQASEYLGEGQANQRQEMLDALGEGIYSSRVHQENKTGLPDNLKASIENLSGMSLDDVKVHYNSSKPSQLQALAYTQGTDIYVEPAQEKHLAHEAWHVVQQKQGRVKPTLQAKGEVINEEEGLEREADVMGAKAGSISLSYQRKGKLETNKSRIEDFLQKKKRGSGLPLADIIRKPKGHAFGTKYNDVRLHTGAQSDQLNQLIQTKAFTTGHDIFFWQGEYDSGIRCSSNYKKQTPAISPIQRILKYGPYTLRNEEDVKKRIKENDLLSSKVKPQNKDQVKKERMDALIDLVKDEKIEVTANNKQTLIEEVTKHQTFLQNQRAGLTAGSSTSSTSAEEQFTDVIESYVKELQDTQRVFPSKEIINVAKKAQKDSGFMNELTLALTIVKEEKEAKVQLGKVRQNDLPSYLGYELSESLVQGGVGADITIWRKKESGKKTTFIQAKTANKNTVKSNVESAANQLASLTASGDPQGKLDQREFTLTGSSYEGVIFVTILDESVDIDTLKKIAISAIEKQSLYVHRVIYEFPISKTYYSMEKESNKLEFHQHNPLTQHTPEIVNSTENKELASSSR
ncbi:eCIS core domain-containing protein [Nostoc sp.]|uniref:eCIS core domain-containing protein n=1 Tax=Nostoc sp. TaxID=1180 RepID=UPI002FFC7097